MLPLKAALNGNMKKKKKKPPANLQIFYYDMYDKEIPSGKEAIQN